MTMRSILFGLAVLCALAGGAAWSQRAASVAIAHQPMTLGAATNFSAGWSEATHGAAAELGVTEFRDAIRWADVERERGRYSFADRRVQYPARLAQSGGHLVLTVGGGNPLYDGGQTPYSPEGVAAFGRFVAAVAAEYPAISAIEVGNEFNGADFVSGPVRDGGIAMRARYHLAIVRAVAAEVRKVRPDLPILGGAAHSVPAGYLWQVLNGAEPGLIDGLAIHPYTTPIDQLPAQIGVLRRDPLARSIPIHVTEFGSSDAARAPDQLLRGYAVMASLGFAALDWYPLNERGDGMAALIRRDGSVTPAGEAFRFVQAQLAGEIARDISPDSFTFVHAFGDRRVVLWGEPRPLVLLRGDITAFDARGRRLDPRGLILSADRGLVLVGERPLHPGEDFVLGCSTLIADSFYQFTYPQAGQTAAFAASFGAGAAGGGAPLVAMPGQQRRNVPWVPYLGLTERAGLRLTAQSMVLARGPGALVLRWSPPATGPETGPETGPAMGQIRLDGEFAPPPASRTPLAIAVRQGGRTVFANTQAGAVHFSQVLSAGAGASVEIAILGRAAESTATDYRLRIHDEARCRGESQPGNQGPA